MIKLSLVLSKINKLLGPNPRTEQNEIKDKEANGWNFLGCPKITILIVILFS